MKIKYFMFDSFDKISEMEQWFSDNPDISFNRVITIQNLILIFYKEVET